MDQNYAIETAAWNGLAKLIWGVAMLGAIAILGLALLWAKEVIPYARTIFAKIDAVLIIIMAGILLAYCAALPRGFRRGEFASPRIAWLEIAAYIFWVIVTVLAVTIILNRIFGDGDMTLFSSGEFGLFAGGLCAMSAALLSVMRRRNALPIAGAAHWPARWSPLWFIALTLALALLWHVAAGVTEVFGSGWIQYKLFMAAVLLAGAGFVVYLILLYKSVSAGMILSRSVLYWEGFAYCVLALAAFGGLLKLPKMLLAPLSHYSNSVGFSMGYNDIVRLLLPLLCVLLMGITVWLIRVRRRLPLATA